MYKTVHLPNGTHAHSWTREGSSRAIIVQHGLGEHALEYLSKHNRIISRFLDRGLNVYAVDFDSHDEKDHDLYVSDLTKSIENHFYLVKHVFGIEKKPIYLFGHSLGGLVTVINSIFFRNNISGIVLSSPMLGVDLLSCLAPMLRFVSRLSPKMTIFSIDRKDLTNKNTGKYKKEVIIKVPARFAASILIHCRNARDIFHKFEAPVLIVHGASDSVTNPKFSKMFFDKIRSKSKKITIYSGEKHEMIDDANGEKIINDVTSWILSEKKSQSL
ncbi:alpha/beta fold hydrolase [Asaia sp. HN010]|uniref:alpha/beta fold hydrolase n=1 Tax=Asaia sp. HN010 TaxID=3081233 RepID=UPI003018605C